MCTLHKLQTFDKNILYNCMLYMDCWPLKYEYYNRRAKFSNKLKMNENSVVATWLNVSGFNEFKVIWCFD